MQARHWLHTLAVLLISSAVFIYVAFRAIPYWHKTHPGLSNISVPDLASNPDYRSRLFESIPEQDYQRILLALPGAPFQLFGEKTLRHCAVAIQHLDWRDGFLIITLRIENLSQSDLIVPPVQVLQPGCVIDLHSTAHPAQLLSAQFYQLNEFFANGYVQISPLNECDYQLPPVPAPQKPIAGNITLYLFGHYTNRHPYFLIHIPKADVENWSEIRTSDIDLQLKYPAETGS